ncbi:hypothetical protein [Methylobacter sp. YRD-M1]|nr:hypothetical protein [Methylobacter sp. YRD-M1]WAK01023.1 hypothetical protein LZ558_14420 [Methylobacter sp. YRD-M1]
MLTSFLFTRVYALAYANCVSANFMGCMGLFDGIPGLHASIVRAAGPCC